MEFLWIFSRLLAFAGQIILFVYRYRLKQFVQCHFLIVSLDKVDFIKYLKISITTFLNFPNIFVFTFKCHNQSLVSGTKFEGLTGAQTYDIFALIEVWHEYSPKNVRVLAIKYLCHLMIPKVFQQYELSLIDKILSTKNTR